MREKHKLFMNIAKEFAKQSTCCRKQVGAVLVKDGRIVSTGYNGSLPGHLHCNAVEKFNTVDWSKTKVNSAISKAHHEFASQHEVHAEQNVIAFAAKSGVSTEGCSLYITLTPCPDCSKLIVAAGIKEVYYLEDYDRSSSGKEFLQMCGLYVQKVIL